MTTKRGHRFFNVVLFAGLLAGFSTLSQAYDSTTYTSPISFGPRASYFKPKDADGKWSGGAQLRLWPGSPVGFEGSVDYRRETFGDTEVHIYPVQASILLNLIPHSPVNLFALGGAGWYYTHIDRPDPFKDDTDNRLGVHAGGGLLVHLGAGWSLDGTYRYVWLDKLTTKDAALQDKQLEDSGHQVTIGLNYNF
jgi:opacity protein-like surface antigen